MAARANALIAAAQASDATAELLRFVREGDAIEGHAFGDAEPVEKLAEAALLAAEIEYDGLGDPCWAEEREIVGEFIAACRRFIEGWAG